MANNANQVFKFHWRGFTLNQKKIKGQFFACSEIEVRELLLNQQIQIVKIKKRTPSSYAKRQHKATAKDITLLTRQLATMLEAGIPLNNILKLLKANAKKAQIRTLLTQISSQIEAGASFSQALRKSSALFDDFYCDLVAVGEQTGRLDSIFSRLYLYREKSENIRSKVFKAMIYPSIVFTVAIGVTIAMLIFVIPTFEDIFKTFDAKMPWFTQLILDLSRFLQHNGLSLFISICLLVLLFRFFYNRYYQLRLKVAQFLLKVPVIGDVLTKATIARFTRTLATTFSAGVPLLTGIIAARKTTNNLHYEKVIEQVHQQTLSGKPFHCSIQETEAFSDMMVQMIMIGEESGKLDEMLNKIASLYENEVDDIVDNLGKIIEPFIILTLGLLIGALVIAMYLPMFNLMSVIS